MAGCESKVFFYPLYKRAFFDLPFVIRDRFTFMLFKSGDFTDNTRLTLVLLMISLDLKQIQNFNPKVTCIKTLCYPRYSTELHLVVRI